jgi:tetratricopeptide (TPR) repeat protein
LGPASFYPVIFELKKKSTIINLMSNSSRLDQLLKMLEQEPEDDFLNHALAMEYLSANKIMEAISVFENLLRRNPGYLASYYQLGQALEKTGDIKKAIDAYRKGIEIATAQKNRKAQGELNEALWMLED